MIYIQTNDHKIPHHFDCACALYGATDLGMDYKLVHYDEVSAGRFDSLINRHLFVGSVEFMREVFKRVGKNDIRLPQNSNRECEIINLREAKRRASLGEHIFIKPYEIKLFTGFVLDRSQYSCLNGLSDDTKVIAYKPFKLPIESEWRIYVHNHKIVDSRNYSGDCLSHPLYHYVRHVIHTNENTFPCAYTIDIGILTNKDNNVVEYNDMWAIGNYGMPNDMYVRALKQRYFEIINTKNK